MIEKTILKLISRNDTLKALEQLQNFAQENKNHPLHDMTIQLQRRFHETREKEIKGIVSSQEVAVENAKINDAIIDLVRGITIEKDESVVAPKSNAKIALIAFGSLALIALAIWLISTFGNKAPEELIVDKLQIKSTHKAGTYDKTFANKGFSIVPFSNQSKRVAHGFTMALQDDGKILVGGRTWLTDNTRKKNQLADFALMRFKEDGSLDTTFGRDGKLQMNFIPKTNLVSGILALQKDGKILFGGNVREYIRDSMIQEKMVLSRFRQDGQPDSDLGSDGQLILPQLDEYNSISSLILDEDENIIIVGTSGEISGKRKLLLMRLKNNGISDDSFGNDGKAMISAIPYVSFLGSAGCLDKENNIIVGGYAKKEETAKHEFFVARFKPDGKFHGDFGSSGFMTIPFKDDQVRVHARANAVAVQDDGKILISGLTKATADHSEKFAIARVLPNGQLDKSFNYTGQKIIKSKNKKSVGNISNAMLIQPDGKIILAGQSTDPVKNINHLSFIRLREDGQLDESFGNNDGKVFLDDIGGYSTANAISLQKNGLLVAAGLISYPQQFIITRLHIGLPYDGYEASKGNNKVWYWPQVIGNEVELGFNLLRPGMVSLDIQNKNGEIVQSPLKNIAVDSVSISIIQLDSLHLSEPYELVFKIGKIMQQIPFGIK